MLLEAVRERVWGSSSRAKTGDIMGKPADDR